MPICWHSSRDSFLSVQKERWLRLFGRRFLFAGGIADDGDAGWDVVSDNAPCTDDGIVANGDAGEDDSASTNPDISADADGETEFEVGATGFGVARVIGCIDLYGGTDLGAVADFDAVDVEQDAVKVEKNTGAEVNVVAVVAEEWWANGGVFAAGADDLFK